MRIQIDTSKKTLRLESDVSLEEFMSKIKVLFPNGEWKEYRLETNVEIVWSNPITYYPSYPSWPWWVPCGTLTTNSSDTVYIDSYNMTLPETTTVYNVEV